MDKRVLDWLKQNTGKIFRSPREEVFRSKPYPFKLVAVDEKKEVLKIDFIGGKSKALPLYFWMFNRTIDYLDANKGRYIWLGAKVKPPYYNDTIEGEIWKDPCPYTSPYRVSPFVCDFLVLSGLAEYGYARNPETGRKVQGIKISGSRRIRPTTYPEPHIKSGQSVKTDTKNAFLRRYKDAILYWTEENEDKIIEGRAGYSWQNKPTLECVKSRNDVSREIVLSRIRNGGGVDLETLDKVTMWGFGRRFPLRDTEKALKISRKAFSYLDEGDLQKAIKTLLEIHDVGIARASKVIGLFDQENLCIYDSRVGNALKFLKHGDEKIILCPPSYTRKYDIVSNKGDWAEQYERLIWTLEVIQDNLNRKGCTFRLADIEMALFMMGK